MPDGTLHLLLVIANPDAVTPYDPESTGLPGEEHYYVTSVPRDHCWIAQQGEGPNARPDISIGGQRLDLPLGRVIDGECQARVIDDPAPIVGVACGADVVIPEGDASLNLGPNSFDAGPTMWHRHETDNSGTYEDGEAPGTGGILAQIIGGNPGFAGSILFGSNTYNGYLWRVLGGFTPGERYGFHCRVTWGLDTGPGNLAIETIGAVDPITGLATNRVSFPDGTWDFWTIDPSLSETVFDGYMSAIADPAGEIEFRFVAENYGGSTNVVATLNDMEIVTCEEVLTPGDPTQLYTTGSLADDNARHHLLGRQYYLKASTDGGTAFTEMIYAGFTKQITMERSKTFLLTGGDAGRGRRVSRAWRDLNPVED